MFPEGFCLSWVWWSLLAGCQAELSAPGPRTLLCSRHMGWGRLFNQITESPRGLQRLLFIFQSDSVSTVLLSFYLRYFHLVTADQK